MDKFRNHLQKRNIPTRFSIDKHVEDIPNMLLECYKDEVRCRNMKFVPDTTIEKNIGKASVWLTDPTRKPGLLLYGVTGNGKTTLARSIVRLINMFYSERDNYDHYLAKAKAVSALELSVIAKNDPDAFDKLKWKDVLFIDDAGCEPTEVKNYGNVINPFTDLMYYRYDQMKCTIITSNLALNDMKSKYGERLADRLTEMLDTVAFTNKSYRR